MARGTASDRIVSDEQLQAEHFERVDESPDSLFYEQPRLVKHIDEPACEALADYFRDHLPEDGAILDLMSSYVSHLPTDVSYERVCGLGMNKVELDANPQLTDYLIHDLSITPKLPFLEDEFDACIISVSVQRTGTLRPRTASVITTATINIVSNARTLPRGSPSGARTRVFGSDADMFQQFLFRPNDREP